MTENSNGYVVLFWSGGKDSLLALNELRKKPYQILLLTTYDRAESVVPYQQIPVSEIYSQSISLGIPVFTVPLPHPCSNEVYLKQVSRHLSDIPFKIDALAFGDWFLEDIRKWRETEFRKLGYHCLFPIWKKPLEELLEILFSMDVKIYVSNVDPKFEEIIDVGSEYNREFIKSLPDKINPMGENGEFHTKIVTHPSVFPPSAGWHEGGKDFLKK